ncbi:glycoside hydrolase superfamily [Paraphoma chrysanthemicola]|uniref:chitinase n=1 Tax=Paraphoma chrysanthemicola TaxID=798071 RepID=A0A8K0RJR3_9PLEO|nr:glycoside hydrolase superfamily [Paraphoma chrysanthemicola]
MMGAGEWYPPSQPSDSEASSPTNGYTGTVGHPHTKPTDNPPSYPTTTKYTAPTTIPKPPVGDRDGYRAVGYYGNWDIYARNFTPQQIPASRLTHLLYSFADNRPDGTVFLTDTFADVEKHWATDSWSESGNNMYGSLKQLGLLKQKNRNLKVMLSIGGWTYTNEKKHMDPVGASATAIQTFAKSCVDMVRNYGFDGIDIDWEYPQDATQGLQFLAMLRETRKSLDAYADQMSRNKGYAEEAKPKFLLSIAAPAGEANYKNMPLKEVGEVVDFVNLMVRCFNHKKRAHAYLVEWNGLVLTFLQAYDYAGAWDKTTGHSSNLAPSRSNPKSTPYNTDSVVQHYLRSGVPSQKLNLGMPLYGHAFTNTYGLGQPYNGNGKGSFEAGIYDFKDLPLEGATEYWDEEAYATYSYDNSSHMLVSYDTVEMALTKVGYIKQNKLGGAMWWEVSGDKIGKGSIITNVRPSSLQEPYGY